MRTRRRDVDFSVTVQLRLVRLRFDQKEAWPPSDRAFGEKVPRGPFVVFAYPPVVERLQVDASWRAFPAEGPNVPLAGLIVADRTNPVVRFDDDGKTLEEGRQNFGRISGRDQIENMFAAAARVCGHVRSCR